MKLNKKGVVIGEIAAIFGIAAILAGVGEFKRQAGDWGIKDGVKGKSYVEGRVYPTFHFGVLPE